MKIVHIITRLFKGGAEENTLMTCLYQASCGHDVTLIYGPDNLAFALYAHLKNTLRFILAPSLRRQINPVHDFIGLMGLIALLRELKPDVVHTHTSKAGILGRLAAKCAGVPHVVHSVHIVSFINAPAYARVIYLAAERFASFFTDLFLHVSYGTLCAYADAKIGVKKPHRVVYSGMDLNKFTAAYAPKSWRELLNVPPEAQKPRVILMLAALEPRKQPLRFIDGFACSTKPGDPIRLLIAGEGPLKSKIDQKVKELGLDDRVVQLGYSAEPERLIALADVGVLASVREGLPRVVVQYLAGRCPAIVSDIDGIDEIVANGINGLVIPSLDAADVAKAAVGILRDPERLNILKQGAVRTSVDAWSFPSMFTALDNSYSLLDSDDAECRALASNA
ncbi:MAG: glycosyltransferase [Alphaproteobacteria bacterium]|nr:glycosyltransferase [Alphaproteobacteria bacterium]